MRRLIVHLLAGVLTLGGLTSCFELEESIHLREDGSGTITEKVLLGAALVRLRESEAAGRGEGARGAFADLYDVEKYKRRAKRYGEGVSFLKVEKIEREGAKGVRVTYRFDDINTVSFSPGSALEEKNIADGPRDAAGAPRSEPLTFEYEAGVLTIKVPEIARGAEGGNEPAVPALENLVLQMFKDMKLRAAMTIEPGIANSNATYAEGKTITFLDLDFARIVENPKGAKALQAVGKATRADLAAALRGVPGAKIETRESIRVKLREGP